MTQPILILNGPNLNFLGRREPHLYGNKSFEEVLQQLRVTYPQFVLHYFQSNHEGAIIDRLQQAVDESLVGLIVNMGAFTHYSYAIHDALKLLSVPIIEVHISHIFSREVFRHQSVIAPACEGMICGLGVRGYQLAIEWFINKM